MHMLYCVYTYAHSPLIHLCTHSTLYTLTPLPLPPSLTPYPLSPYTRRFQKNVKLINGYFNDPQVEGVYETKCPLLYKSILKLGMRGVCVYL